VFELEPKHFIKIITWRYDVMKGHVKWLIKELNTLKPVVYTLPHLKKVLVRYKIENKDGDNWWWVGVIRSYVNSSLDCNIEYEVLEKSFNDLMIDFIFYDYDDNVEENNILEIYHNKVLKSLKKLINLKFEE
jgi:hypothetical protein